MDQQLIARILNWKHLILILLAMRRFSRPVIVLLLVSLSWAAKLRRSTRTICWIKWPYIPPLLCSRWCPEMPLRRAGMHRADHKLHPWPTLYRNSRVQLEFHRPDSRGQGEHHPGARESGQCQFAVQEHEHPRIKNGQGGLGEVRRLNHTIPWLLIPFHRLQRLQEELWGRRQWNQSDHSAPGARRRLQDQWQVSKDSNWKPKLLYNTSRVLLGCSCCLFRARAGPTSPWRTSKRYSRLRVRVSRRRAAPTYKRMASKRLWIPAEWTSTWRICTAATSGWATARICFWTKTGRIFTRSCVPPSRTPSPKCWPG